MTASPNPLTVTHPFRSTILSPSHTLIQTTTLLLLTCFVVAPIVCSCLVSLIYSLYLFIAYEESGVHHAQEFENRFWTIFAMLFMATLVFASDSPMAFGMAYPLPGTICILLSGYLMHLWDRYQHRLNISRQVSLRRNQSGSQSLLRLRDLGIPVEEQLARINHCLKEIDQLLIPSTINNFLNQRFVMSREREIINIFEECDARALNYLIAHVKLGLLFYKIKDHRNFNGKHRTELINLLAVERLSILTVISRVILLHSLQLLKLRANPQAENWVRNIILNTHQDALSELKTLTDTKGDYFCMPKLIYDDIRSETVRQDILRHIRREAAIQQTHIQMGTKRYRSQMHRQWRKVLSDVDDTLYCSGGMYPAGVDKRFSRKTVYPGVMAFYRELDLGTADGPEEWQDDRVGNLVFLSARPHVYKDMSEKINYAKFEKLRAVGADGRKGLHTMPSLLSGDLASGGSFLATNDFEPLAKKKFDNFRRFVSIYPEFQHVFVCDNGQGDVRAGEMMFDSFPYEFEGLYVHLVTDADKTYGYSPERWKEKEFRPFFFKTYPEAALHAATRYPPLIRLEGLRRICADSVKDFELIKQWPSELAKAERRWELNQSVWRANQFLEKHGSSSVDLILAEQKWPDGEKVRTPYGIATVRGFDPLHDLYSVELDWRPLNTQVDAHNKSVLSRKQKRGTTAARKSKTLETVVETDEVDDEITGKAIVQQGGQSTAENQDDDIPYYPFAQSPSKGSISGNSEGSFSSGGSVDDAEDDADDENDYKSPVRAQIGSRFITKYTPPVLPKVDTKRSSPPFSFWPPAEPEEVVLAVPVGEKCSTPYGVGKVLEYRKSDKVVVVEMVGWPAKAYLNESCVKHIQKGLLGSLLERLTLPDAEQKPDYPYVEGTTIITPFGAGTLQRPVLSPKKTRDTLKKRAPKDFETVAIALSSWKLANGKSPVVYCTPESAKIWKESNGRAQDSIFSLSALENLVSNSRNLLPFLAQKEVPTPKVAPEVSRYYTDGAAVSTDYGKGVVKAFRPSDGFYTVSLVSWKLADGSHPVAHLRKDDIRTRIAVSCQEGYPVLTNLGVSGTLASVEPTTGFHIVTIPSSVMVCYLQPECIVRPLKAAVGEEVMTAFGEGKVVFYDKPQDTYRIRLHGWNATLYAKSDTFERISEGVQDRDGPFGVNWLLGFFFSGESNNSSVTRSRSNSVVSGSQSNRSVT